MRGIGINACKNEQCLYINLSGQYLALIHVYVDDLIIFCQDKDDLMWIKSKISQSFECVDHGQLHMFLGIEIQMQLHWM